MKVLKKAPNKDFTVLNLTDPQLSTEEWADGHLHRKILENTVKTYTRTLYAKIGVTSREELNALLLQN